MGCIVSAGAEGVKEPVGTCVAMHCLEPWFDPVPANVIGGSKMSHQTPPEPAHVEAAPQAQAPELSPMDVLRVSLNRSLSIDEYLEIGHTLHKEKEGLAHGEFGPFLDSMGITRSFAHRCMAAFTWAGEFEKVRFHVGSVSKLVALLPLGYIRLRELEHTGCTGGLKLADIAGMTVKQLRQAVKAVKAGADPEHQAMLDGLKATDTPH